MSTLPTECNHIVKRDYFYFRGWGINITYYKYHRPLPPISIVICLYFHIDKKLLSQLIQIMLSLLFKQSNLDVHISAHDGHPVLHLYSPSLSIIGLACCEFIYYVLTNIILIPL